MEQSGNENQKRTQEDIGEQAATVPANPRTIPMLPLQKKRHTGELEDRPLYKAPNPFRSDELEEYGFVTKWSCCGAEEYEIPDPNHKNTWPTCKVWWHEPEEGVVPPVDTWNQYNLEQSEEDDDGDDEGTQDSDEDNDEDMEDKDKDKGKDNGENMENKDENKDEDKEEDKDGDGDEDNIEAPFRDTDEKKEEEGDDGKMMGIKMGESNSSTYSCVRGLEE
ncbi:hypothetical protein F5Y10DRAFT_265249 [Nemania abortiva]|nr:hypothetical protein F5Y10DRAFT_265249 [Nemania abortiva]